MAGAHPEGIDFSTAGIKIHRAKDPETKVVRFRGARLELFGASLIPLPGLSVTTDGRARDCTVASSSVDAETTARVCPLVVQRIRFNPARLADGTAVEARYGYRVSFTAR